VGCTTTPSWQGSPLRAPVASLRLWLFQGIEPVPEPETVSPVNHEQGLETCLSTCTEPCTNVWPSDHQSGERSCSHRYPHDDFIETNPARIGCRHLAEDGSLSGVYRHPQTQLVGLGDVPLHRHRTMHNRTFCLCGEAGFNLAKKRLQVMARHIQDRLEHERIEVNILWGHECYAFDRTQDDLITIP